MDDGADPAGGPLPLERRVPHPARFGPRHPGFAAAMTAHEAALAEGRSTYLDPRTGLTVMTAATLWARGWCCDSGCRHCPFVER